MKLSRTFATIALLSAAGMAQAAGNCTVSLKGDDAMKFDLKEATVSASCPTITIELTHSGKLPVTAMGHNWVLSHASDEAGVVADGMKAGAANSYEKPGDSRIIAHTKLIGAGESDTATINVAKLKAGEQYAFFCTFPGHAALMKGTLSLGK